MDGLGFQWLGRVPYGEALARQRLRREGVIAGTAPEVIWLLEHDPPVITVGRREAAGVPDAAWLGARGVERFAVERGGLATWHGPGQLVAYVIVDAGRRGMGVKATVAALESAVIRWLRERAVDARRRDRHPGVWVGSDKICAVGLHFHRGVTLHGLALNLDPDMTAWTWFVPCGISDGGVTSLRRLGIEVPAIELAAAELGAALVGEIEGAGREDGSRRPALTVTRPAD